MCPSASSARMLDNEQLVVAVGLSSAAQLALHHSDNSRPPFGCHFPCFYGNSFDWFHQPILDHCSDLGGHFGGGPEEEPGREDEHAQVVDPNVLVDNHVPHICPPLIAH